MLMLIFSTDGVIFAPGTPSDPARHKGPVRKLHRPAAYMSSQPPVLVTLFGYVLALLARGASAALAVAPAAVAGTDLAVGAPAANAPAAFVASTQSLASS